MQKDATKKLLLYFNFIRASLNILCFIFTESDISFDRNFTCTRIKKWVITLLQQYTISQVSFVLSRYHLPGYSCRVGLRVQLRNGRIKSSAHMLMTCYINTILSKKKTHWICILCLYYFIGTWPAVRNKSAKLCAIR